MKNTLLAFLLGTTAISSSMTGEALASNNYHGGVAVQEAPLMTFPKEVFTFNTTELMGKKISDIATGFEIQRNFNAFMENQRKALEDFAVKNKQIKNDELLARQLQNQYDAEFARSLAEQDGIALHEAALENFAVKNKQVKDDELLARRLQSQYDAEFARSLGKMEQEEVVAPVVKANPRANLLASIENFDASALKAVAPVVKADPRANLLASIENFDASALKTVAPVVKANPRANLLASIGNFDASNLKVVAPVVKAERRPLPTLPTALKKVEEVQQPIRQEVVPVQRDVILEPVVEKATTIMDVLARQISGFSQQSLDESAQTADEAIAALRLAVEEGDIDGLDDKAFLTLEEALKGNAGKLSWLVSECYSEGDGWNFDFIDASDIMKEMKKTAEVEKDIVEDKPLSQQRVGRVNKLNLNVDSGLNFLDQIRLARGVVEAEEDRDFVRAPVINTVEEVEDKPVVIKATPAKKVVVKVLDEGNNSGNLLSAIAGFNLTKLNKVDLDKVEEKIDSPKSHLELALAARRTAIVNDSDDEDESWDDF
ncbi:MAG: hypothetical protein GW748_03885 [Alphaproteobacteria bacterium]|nr:hypothetical protein [Alphaproteobacteria bacterium]NCQ66865.1 hypothetical protein [Alphaproteobacteria bacterium]NCT07433.1 hypothetical protein [Alphaproteobacteria bacterium]